MIERRIFDLSYFSSSQFEEIAKEGKKFSEDFSEQGKKFSEEFGKKFDETASKTPYLKQLSESIKGASEELLEGSKHTARLYGGFRDTEERRREKARREKLHHEAMKAQEEANRMEADPKFNSI